MRRTKVIYTDDMTHSWLDDLARMRGVSMGEVVKQLVVQGATPIEKQAIGATLQQADYNDDMASQRTFTRNCSQCGRPMVLVIRYQTGNEIVRCQACKRNEEISNSGMVVPQPQKVQERTK
jgi:hypothetical protein